MTLDREATPGTPAVVITLGAVDGATKSVRWRLNGSGQVAEGRLRPGQTREVRLRVPPCRPAGPCSPARWTLRASGPPVGTAVPAIGPAGDLRPVVLHMSAARLLAR
jgi:hypothetical protein